MITSQRQMAKAYGNLRDEDATRAEAMRSAQEHGYYTEFGRRSCMEQPLPPGWHFNGEAVVKGPVRPVDLSFLDRLPKYLQRVNGKIEVKSEIA